MRWMRTISFSRNGRAVSITYAVKATEARVCMWEGKYKEALEAIEELFMKKQVIPWVDPESSVHVEEKMRDLSFTAEHIFYLEVNQLYKTLRPYVEQYKINADFSSTDNEKVFYTTKTKGESLYEIADGDRRVGYPVYAVV